MNSSNEGKNKNKYQPAQGDYRQKPLDQPVDSVICFVVAPPSRPVPSKFGGEPLSVKIAGEHINHFIGFQVDIFETVFAFDHFLLSGLGILIVLLRV